MRGITLFEPTRLRLCGDRTRVLVCVSLFVTTFGAPAPSLGAFTDVAPSVGLDVGGDKEGGVVWADLDGDGDLDVVVNTASALGTRLLISSGGANPTFTDMTAELAPFLVDRALERSVLVADLNGDGYVDIVRNTASRVEIALNRGPDATPPWSFGTAELAADSFFGTAQIPGLNCEGVGLLDVDRDGFLEIVAENGGSGILLLRNPSDGSARFTVGATGGTGLDAAAGQGDYLSVADVDGDGWTDLFVRRDAAPDYLRRDPSAFAWAAQAVPDLSAPGEDKGGIALCDLDNDGDLDAIYAGGGVGEAGSPGAGQSVFVQSGGAFALADVLPALPAADYDDVACGDYDNDGDLDLFFVSSAADVLLANRLESGSLRFEAVSEGIVESADGSSAVFADYDRDGDLDLLVNQDGANALWRNDLGGSSYLVVRVGRATASGRVVPDIGARVRLLDPSGALVGPVQEVSGGRGHGTQDVGALHFGLRDGADALYRVEVTFSSPLLPRAVVPVVPAALGAYQELVIVDRDPDGDGLDAAAEAAAGTDPSSVDTDGDGLSDGDELNGTGPLTGIGPTSPTDADSDDDGVSDGHEVLSRGPMRGRAPTNPTRFDTDGDGLGDGLEVGVVAGIPGGVSPGGYRYEGTAAGFRADADPRSTTDPLLADTDADGLSDGEEDANRDGRTIGTLGGTGSSGSGETNPNNPDTDGDGLRDGFERNVSRTDPLDTDTDDGGVPDGAEVAAGTDPLDPADDAAARDTDGDGLPDALEALLGTDRTDRDTDDDGLSDGLEISAGDPLLYEPGIDTDPLDSDTDDDGLVDGLERGLPGALGTDPLNPDTDGDGLTDGLERGVRTGAPPGQSAGRVPFRGTDTSAAAWRPDADPATRTDATNPDTDGDGIPDGIEDANRNGRVDNRIGGTGTTGSGETDPNSADTDGDGLGDGDETRTSPVDTDTDDGGVADGDEVRAGTDPMDPNDDFSRVGDADSDGLDDATEAVLGTDPLDPDTDDDGLSDRDEVAPPGGLLAEATDPLDADTDDDGILDGDERGGVGPLLPFGPTDPLGWDTDGDGLSDGLEVGLLEPIPGGVSDGPARVRYSGTDPARFVADADPETTTDPRDVDTDGDGLEDGDEDRDRDGAVGDGETAPGVADTDGGGIPDGLEVRRGTNPLDPSDDIPPGGDDDLDGLSNERERELGTDPTAADTDGDGLGDGREVYADNPTDPRDPDTDGDGLCDGPESVIGTCVAGEDLDANGRVSRGETDPNDPDTDGGGASDGQELLRDGTDPLDPTDDVPGAESYSLSGRGLVQCGSSPGAPGWWGAAVLGLVLLRRRRRGGARTGAAAAGAAAIGAASLVCALSVPAPSSAADRFDVQRFAPASDASRGFWATSAGSTAPRDTLVLGATTHWSSASLVAAPIGGGEELRVVSGRLDLDLAAAWGATDWLELSAALPVVLLQRGDEASAILGSGRGVSSAGLGDARFAVRLQLVGPNQRVRSHGFDLSIGCLLHAPTGDDDSFRGEPARLTPNVTAEWSSGSGVRLAASGGWRFRRYAALADLDVDDEAVWSVAGALPLGSPSAQLVVDVIGTVATVSREHTTELLAGVRAAAGDRVWLEPGLGVGLVGGVGTPSWRAFLRASWSGRTDGDRDADGIPGQYDRCPREPEDFDGYQDDDGCPDGGAPGQDGPSPRTEQPGAGDAASESPVSARAPEPGAAEPSGASDAPASPLEQPPGPPAALPPAPVEQPASVGADGWNHVEPACNAVYLLRPIPFDGAQLRPDADPILDEVTRAILLSDASEVVVEAHTSSAGEAGDNLVLTQARAEAVAERLRAGGVAIDVRATGYGEEMPIADNETEEGREQNERIEFWLDGECTQ